MRDSRSVFDVKESFPKVICGGVFIEIIPVKIIAQLTQKCNLSVLSHSANCLARMFTQNRTSLGL